MRNLISFELGFKKHVLNPGLILTGILFKRIFDKLGFANSGFYFTNNVQQFFIFNIPWRIFWI